MGKRRPLPHPPPPPFIPLNETLVHSNLPSKHFLGVPGLISGSRGRGGEGWSSGQIRNTLTPIGAKIELRLVR